MTTTRCTVCARRPATTPRANTARGTEGMCAGCRSVWLAASTRGWTLEAWTEHQRELCVKCHEQHRGVIHPDTRPCDTYLCGNCRAKVREHERRARLATEAA